MNEKCQVSPCKNKAVWHVWWPQAVELKNQQGVVVCADHGPGGEKAILITATMKVERLVDD